MLEGKYITLCYLRTLSMNGDFHNKLCVHVISFFNGFYQVEPIAESRRKLAKHRPLGSFRRVAALVLQSKGSRSFSLVVFREAVLPVVCLRITAGIIGLTRIHLWLYSLLVHVLI